MTKISTVKRLLPILWGGEDYKIVLLQLYINKLDSLDKNFLETQNLPRLKHEEIQNLNRPITSKGIELEIQNLPTK